MQTSQKMRAGMLAATSLLAASAALAPAHALAMDDDLSSAVVEAPAAQDFAQAADHADKRAPMGKRLALIAVAGGVLAALIRLIGAKKVMRAVGRTAGQTAKVATAAAAGTIRAAGRVFRSPLRYLAWMAGLIFFALTGVGLYDIEWIGGLAAGAALMGLAAMGTWKLRMALRPARMESGISETRQTKINQ